MRYFKIMQGETVITAEAHEDPVYICRQKKNNILLRCPEEQAQGILSLRDGNTVYQLYGKESLELDNDYTAYPTVLTEYEEIISSNPPEEVIEDFTPEVPEGSSAERIPTRAELAAMVAALTEELAATKILLGVSDE